MAALNTRTITLGTRPSKLARWQTAHTLAQRRPADAATSASSASEWSVGLNWYLNRNVRVGTSFSHTDFSGGGGTGSSAPAAVTRQSENVLFTRIQLAF